jgi:hypothetical protein
MISGQNLRIRCKSVFIYRVDTGKTDHAGRTAGYGGKKISRWYNVKIILQDHELRGYFLTATIENEKPEQTMRLISMALPVDFTVTDRKTESERNGFFI